MHDSDDIPAVALGWHRAGRGAALATVVETWGSAPRPVGAQLAVDGQGAMEGSVSGGCVEGAVVAEAIEAIADGRPRLLTYGVSDGDAFSVGLACGGTIRVLVDPVGGALEPALLEDLVAARAAHRPVAMVSALEGPERRLAPPEEFPDRFTRDASGVEEGRLIAVHNPPLRLVVVGAVHVAQALVPMARQLGYAPVIVDPRPGFASADRFTGETLVDDWPDEALEALGIDARTAVVTLTHDPKLDDPALRVALTSRAFYVGALGSRRTHAQRMERLADLGPALDRLDAPVGLDIGARSPAEIALSVLAAMTLTLRGPKFAPRTPEETR
ncbi:XdhC family protein [Pseudoroseicyclus aestuarii]|uniref:Xanthine dehydrogenase accessory factor n=1 Tax=Pseudoroseicyclus aestuarii TaxID=1795041 RepID=A0A318T611_9RHOB|nr:XdhC/CoxI family protein [Pseudoroseicyclus aestuarii]PYE85854.1 xanthine dehydrogenase accessory factor [Pseudoroseicyclus aestuarii]